MSNAIENKSLQISGFGENQSLCSHNFWRASGFISFECYQIRGGIFNSYPSRYQLEIIIQDHDLVVVIPKNRKFTWNNHRLGVGNIMEWVDRFIVVVPLLSFFSVASSYILSSSASDHYPITLSLGDQPSLGPLPFKYNPLWNDIMEARQLVHNT